MSDLEPTDEQIDRALATLGPATFTTATANAATASPPKASPPPVT